jgi:hypothetical protein
MSPGDGLGRNPERKWALIALPEASSETLPMPCPPGMPRDPGFSDTRGHHRGRIGLEALFVHRITYTAAAACDLARKSGMTRRRIIVRV